mgnify:CR=1 FL=1
MFKGIIWKWYNTANNRTNCDSNNLSEIKRFIDDINKRECYTNVILNSNNLIKAIKLHNAVIVYSKYHTLELMNYYIL